MKKQKCHISINSDCALMAMIAQLVAGAFMFLVMPIYVGALADYSGFNNDQISKLTSVEMVGMLLASIIGIFIVRKISWKKLSIALSLVLLIANLLSVMTSADYYSLLILRFIAGLSGGGLVALSITAIGDTRFIDKNFAIAIVMELTLSSLAFYIFPDWVVSFGVDAIFVCLAMTAVIAFIASFYMPVKGKPHQVADQRVVYLPVWGLLGTVAFYIAVSAVWAFVERIGVSSNFSYQYIGNVLSVSTLMGLLGALSAVWLFKWLSRGNIMLLCTIGQLLSLFGLLEGGSEMTYIIAASTFQFFWNLWLPTQMASIADIDVSGHFTVLIGASQALGVALGPPIVVAFMHQDDLLAANIVSGIGLLVALALFIPVINCLRTDEKIVVG